MGKGISLRWGALLHGLLLHACISCVMYILCVLSYTIRETLEEYIIYNNIGDAAPHPAGWGRGSPPPPSRGTPLRGAPRVAPGTPVPHSGARRCPTPGTGGRVPDPSQVATQLQPRISGNLPDIPVGFPCGDSASTTHKGDHQWPPD
jgi:hypothetical protein